MLLALALVATVKGCLITYFTVFNRDGHVAGMMFDNNEKICYINM